MNNIKGLSEKKRAEVAGMVSLNEITNLIQKLKSIMDDSKYTVIDVSVSSNNTYVHLDTITFLTEFIEFDIAVDDDDIYPYELKAEISGVEFMAVMSAAEILDLKESIPDQWEYIWRKVQVIDNESINH